MNNTQICKSALGLLLIAGGLVPFSSFAGDGKIAFDATSEGALYNNLQQIQSSRDEAPPMESGARGPVRTETMTPAWSSSEGALYDNLRLIQTSGSMETGAGGTRSGAY